MSEFSFGFALTQELIHHHAIALTAAPYFPTQNEEGRVGGYDVALPRRGVPLFLQFKRSDCLMRSNASEAEQLTLPYYRMHLMATRHSDQHHLLLDLEAQGHEVYYAAPRFHLLAELNEAYLTNTVADRTSFIPPSSIGELPDDDHHYIAIQADDTIRLFCSRNPRRIKGTRTQTLLQQNLRAAAMRQATVIDDNFLYRLGDALVASYADAMPQARQPQRAKARSLRAQRSASDYAREVANTLYGCELLIALADPTKARHQ